jgi:hypothetical protein
MKREFTQIAVHKKKPASLARADTAVSLHAHTFHSKEDLSFIPQYVTRIPIVSSLYRLGMNRHFRLHGRETALIFEVAGFQETTDL